MGRSRDTVFRACGFTILSCVALAAASNLLPPSVKAHWPWLFVFETLAVFAFGISWFVKGQTLLDTVHRAGAAVRTVVARPGGGQGAAPRVPRCHITPLDRCQLASLPDPGKGG
jgi:hypothetical protein